MSVTYKAEAVEFGQAVTPGTGVTTISGLDYGVALTIEKVADEQDGGAVQSVVLTMSLEDAAGLAGSLSDAHALGRFKRFMAKARGQK